MILSFIFIAVGIACLVFGSDFLIDNAALLAKRLGVSALLIGLTVVAFGTSAPELAASLTAVFQGLPSLAMGNVVGSNIFNVLLVLGVSASIAPTPISYDVAANFDIYFLLGSTLLLTFFLFIGTKAQPQAGGTATYTIDRWQAAILFVAVVVYIVYLLVNQYQ